MATIERRTTPGGTSSYRVRVRRQGTPEQTATFARLAEAKAWAQKTEGAIVEGRHFPHAAHARLTLGDVLQRYATARLPQERQETQRHKRLHMTWWHACLGEVLLRDLTPPRLAQARDQLARSLAPATVNRYLATLARILTIAVREWGILEASPLARVERHKEPRGRVRYLGTAERERLLTACQLSGNPHLHLLVLLAIATGGRRGELLSLRWRHVDLVRAQVTFEHTKNDERRTVPVTGLALDQLAQRAQHLPDAMPEDYVFPGEDASRPTAFRQAWDTARRRAQLTDFRFHDLRHSAASYLAMHGASLLDIAAILGHKTLAMTMRYAHLSDAHTGAVAAKMTAAIFGGEDPSRGTLVGQPHPRTTGQERTEKSPLSP